MKIKENSIDMQIYHSTYISVSACFTNIYRQFLHVQTIWFAEDFIYVANISNIRQTNACYM